MSKPDVIWSPLPGSQTIVLSHPWVFELLYHGTRGPGKSDVLLVDFLQDTGKGYGADWRGILIRQTYKQLVDLIVKSKKIFLRLRNAPKWNGSDHTWTWPSGEQLLMRQMLRDDDYWNYHGHQYPWIGWDELCNWPSDSLYKRMISCCRTTNPDINCRIRAATNPYGPGHNWVKLRFALPGLDGVIRKRPFEIENPETGEITIQYLARLAVKGVLRENTILLRAQPNYMSQLRESARNEAELAAWLEGSWDIIAGGMFDDVWDPRVHVVAPFNIPSSWRIDRSFDWGSSAPFSVGWWAESDGSDYLDGTGQWRSSVKGDLYRIGEWYGWNGKPNEGLRMLATEISKGIIEREIKMGIAGRVKPGPADSAIFATENGVCIATDMEKKVRLDSGESRPGARFTAADKRPGSRKTGWEAVRGMLKAALPPKTGNLREKPGLFVFKNCVQFQRTVPVLPRDDKDMDDVDSSTEDHIADEVRYRVRAAGTHVRRGTTTGHY